MKNQIMTEIKDRLFEEFREDHAVLGKGFYQLAERIRAADAAGARHCADKIDREAGSHIFFEEEDFYPALKAYLSAEEIENMYREHADGRSLLQDILVLTDKALDSQDLQQQLLQRVQGMQTHISDCGELFGAMGGLDVNQQAELLRKLEHWRLKAPHWLDQTASSRTNTENS